MPDKFSQEQRSSTMSRVKSGNTKPERIVRSLLHKIGYRFRLQRKDLPGTPDIVLPKYRSVIFVHGCFWHGHPGCPRAARPTTRPEFWNHKLDHNIERDRKAQEELQRLGWRVLIVWQCELRDLTELEAKLRQFLKLPNDTSIIQPKK
ncbi:MAG: DNA mismatch endonuclease Vsr [Caldilinea sp. CFX5]|nr:DNA mismatch endonuclease Vsr [Caldilinea sp. CFX5]